MLLSEHPQDRKKCCAGRFAARYRCCRDRWRRPRRCRQRDLTGQKYRALRGECPAEGGSVLPAGNLGVQVRVIVKEAEVLGPEQHTRMSRACPCPLSGESRNAVMMATIPVLGVQIQRAATRGEMEMSSVQRSSGPSAMGCHAYTTHRLPSSRSLCLAVAERCTNVPN